MCAARFMRRKARFIEKSPMRSIRLFSGGGGRIRTIEAKRSRFTVCPLWPLGNSPRYAVVSQRLGYYSMDSEFVKGENAEVGRIISNKVHFVFMWFRNSVDCLIFSSVEGFAIDRKIYLLPVGWVSVGIAGTVKPFIFIPHMDFFIYCFIVSVVTS